MENIYLAKQPILDRNKDLVAFELFFRSQELENSANPENGLSATANVIVNAYGHLGIQNVLGQQRGFININGDLIRSDLINLLPQKHVVLEISSSEIIDDELIAHCTELKKSGYQFALTGVTSVNENVQRILPLINIVKIDVSRLSQIELTELVKQMKRWPVLFLAEKVESHDTANQCMHIGFEMFQGYFYAKPESISGKRADPAKLSLLNLLTLVMSDSDLEEIDKEFKREPGLSYNLLRMVNSAAVGIPQKVNSIKQSIMLLGRKQLQRWIQLLLYTTENSKNNEGLDNALLRTAAARGKLMELIAAVERPHDKNYQERAFMVGILSLLDTVLGIEMQQIIDKLSIPEDMSQALLIREGRLGLELQLIEANEMGEVKTIQSLLKELDFLNLNELTNLELAALGWVNRIGEAAN
ncbi:EAL and modified HD-GYP domain-containing signal transduction protein [Nitrosomonas marina]|uniref:EAL and modified HD-GYP domain-containing signal transduction protein n=1 Tax=Nitrosomonas marina TaxID=917 RepID=A0A1H9Y392_9PROT|nr:HDOD domain-containing protein [Nitrosomonas marina]SES62807.1 EAL and modified HD-GYP domain-containing signal transduction protein [Nitrosomonas marina]